MHQLRLFGSEDITKIVNVASVPQRSPFRYPGGKTWLIPQIRLWLASLLDNCSTFIEPFAGGGIVSLTVAFENLASKIIMVELDKSVSSVWETLVYGNIDALAERILIFEMSYENLKAEISQETASIEDLAFRTLLRNRTCHGGILAPGGGFLKNGENGKGILSRWYPATLAKRIRNIKSIRDKIEFINGNGFEVIENNLLDPKAIFFIDPPYTAAGKKAGTRLYTHYDLDHNYLFDLMESVSGSFLMTYDNADEIKDLSDKHGFKYKEIAMSNTHHAKMNELLISRDLSWLESTTHY